MGLPGEHVKLIRASPIEKRQASTIAASRQFYESIPCEHILYVQPDGLMLRSPEYAIGGAIHKGPQLLDLMHDYVSSNTTHMCLGKLHHRASLFAAQLGPNANDCVCLMCVLLLLLLLRRCILVPLGIGAKAMAIGVRWVATAV